MPANRLYDTWFQWIRKSLPDERITRVRNLTWLIVGMYLSQSVHLARIGSQLPFQVSLTSVTARLARFLQNGAFRVRDWYRPIAEALLGQAAAQGVVRLIVDGSKVSAHHQLLMVGLAYRKRALPIAWTWVRGARGHSSSMTQLALLHYVYSLVPAHAEVRLVGDCEFGAVAILQQLHAWGWHYVLRQRGDLLVCVDQASRWQRVEQLLPCKDKVFWYPHALLTEQLWHCSLLCYWRTGEKEPWFLATNLVDSAAVLHAYALRMWIEEMYGDWKGHGVYLEQTHLCHISRLARLTFAVALSYLWLVTQGSKTIKRGLRRWVDRKNRRDLSIYRIGLYVIERCCACELPFSVHLIPYFYKL
jgi:hypothetical protein